METGGGGGEGAETGAVCRRIGGEYGLWVFFVVVGSRAVCS